MKNKTNDLYLELAKHIRESVLKGNFDITIPIWGDDIHNIAIDGHDYTIRVNEVYASIRSDKKFWMNLSVFNDLFTFRGEDLKTLESVLEKKQMEIYADMDRQEEKMKQARINKLKEELEKLEG